MNKQCIDFVTQTQTNWSNFVDNYNTFVYWNKMKNNKIKESGSKGHIYNFDKRRFQISDKSEN